MKKKYIYLFLTALSFLFTTHSAFAATPNADNHNGVLDGVIAAIKQLGVEIQALAIASEKTMDHAMYQLDQNLATALQANTNAPHAAAKNYSAQVTQNQIDETFLEFPEQIVTANQFTDPVLVQDINNRQQLLTNLTTNIPATDSLYLDANTDPLAATEHVAKPTAMYDNYFNFDSLFAPNSYNAAEQQAAQSYIEYASQLYQSLANTIDFSSLKSQLNNASLEQRAQMLRNFVTNPVYQQYQLSVRSLLAAKSIALSNLNYLMAERTPVKDLATKAGIPSDSHLPSGYASPLQVENYIANERINNPQWFQQIQTASPATVQREQALILAEIESALQRNHLDNERLLATMSLILLQSNQTSQMALQTQAQNVNAVINPKNSDSANPSSP